MLGFDEQTVSNDTFNDMPVKTMSCNISVTLEMADIENKNIYNESNKSTLSFFW